MPITSSIEIPRVRVDDDLTDLSWLVQMNNPHSKARSSATCQPTSNETKIRKHDRISKPLTVVNGQSTTHRSSSSRLSPQQYSNEENQFYPSTTLIPPTNKRKYDPSVTFHSTKRFHGEQTLPIYPMPSDYILYDETSNSCSTPRTPNLPTSSRYMLLKNDPSLSNTSATAPTSNNYHSSTKLFDNENLYADDIEHLLDIFKNEVEMIGLDPIASTSTADDLSLDMLHCLSSNEFCTY